MQHHMFKLVMNGRLYHVPLENPQEILDIGTGSGIWPIEMGKITCSQQTGRVLRTWELISSPFQFRSSSFPPRRNHRHGFISGPTYWSTRKCSLSGWWCHGRWLAMESKSLRLRSYFPYDRSYAIFQTIITKSIHIYETRSLSRMPWDGPEA